MTKSFRFEGGDDKDTALTLLLLLITTALCCVNIWVRLPVVTFHPAPLIVFLLTRWAYKRHFKNNIDSSAT